MNRLVFNWLASTALAVTMLVTLCAAQAANEPAANAEDQALAPALHPWARFKVGAWKKVRVTTETLGTEGRAASTSKTETTTYLVGVDDDAYELKIDVSVEVVGKLLRAEPQQVLRGLYGESEGQTSVVRRVGGATVTIGNRQIPTSVYEIEINGETTKRLTKMYLSDNVSPHVLKKESITTDPAGDVTISETVEAVLATDMPKKVLGSIKTCWHRRTLRKHAKGSTETLETCTESVPGAVVSATSKEMDADGKVIRRSTLELVGYGEESEHVIPSRRYHKRRARFRRAR